MDDWIDQLKGKRRVFVCVGPGGVGKTSIAGATALSFARRGKRVLCLTIDPAKRLAEALGLADPRAQSAELSSEWFRSAGIKTDGSLHVMMLDVESTFRELILGGKMDEQALESLVSSRPFQFLMRNVMGMQSYMAMERVLAVDESDRYDVIVLDTPPSQRALDFFDAPNRMLDLLSSPLTRVLAQASSGAGRASWVERGAKVALRGLGRITGSGLLEELGAVLGTLSGLLSGFESRAQRAKARFASPEYGCLFVTTPGELELLGAFEMVGQLQARGLGFDAMILNRFVRPLPDEPDFDDVAASLGDRHGADLRRERLSEIWQGRRREADAHAAAYRKVLGELPGGALCATVPEFPGEIQTALDLLNLSSAL
jgi:anion-transporting  ArsA/GET3 family ATPase